MWWIPVGIAASFIARELMRNDPPPRQNHSNRQLNYSQNSSIYHRQLENQRRRFENQKEMVKNWLTSHQLLRYDLDQDLSNASEYVDLKRILKKACTIKETELNLPSTANQLQQVQTAIHLCKSLKTLI